MDKASATGKPKRTLNSRTTEGRRSPALKLLRTLEPLSDTEIAFTRACEAGEPYTFSDERPIQRSKANEIRSSVVSRLITCSELHGGLSANIINLSGCYLLGNLDLRSSSVRRKIEILNCTIEGSVLLDDCTCRSIDLCGTSVQSVSGSRIVCDGTIYFTTGFESSGTVFMPGAIIQGMLNCSGGKFNGGESGALVCDRMQVSGSVFLRDGFVAKGRIRLNGARIGGNLTCTNAHLENSDGIALSCDGTSIEGHLFFRNMVQVEGIVALTGARATGLCDDEKSWRAPLILDGFRYERIDSGPTDAAKRIKWLKLQDPSMDGSIFWAQPWEHLSKVLRDMGHTEDAKLLAMEKQRELRRRKVIGSRKPRTNWSQPWLFFDTVWVTSINLLARLLHLLYGALAGYGHRPLRTLAWMIAAWAAAAAAYGWGAERGVFGPTAPLLLTSSKFDPCGSRAEVGATAWTQCHDLPPEHTQFSALMYSADVILPLVDLRQEADWAPIVVAEDGRPLWDGQTMRWLMWAQILFGWITSLLLVAAAGRLVQKD